MSYVDRLRETEIKFLKTFDLKVPCENCCSCPFDLISEKKYLHLITMALNLKQTPRLECHLPWALKLWALETLIDSQEGAYWMLTLDEVKYLWAN